MARKSLYEELIRQQLGICLKRLADQDKIRMNIQAEVAVYEKLLKKGPEAAEKEPKPKTAKKTSAAPAA